MPALISIIVPVYNVEKYLKRCLSSILANTYKHLEVICINDGSTDHSLDILKEYEMNDNRVKVITQENRGIAYSRNKGLMIAKGDYISFVDSDDWIHFRFFEVLISLCEKHNTDMAMCGFKVTFDAECTDNDLDIDKLKASIICGDDIVLNNHTRSGYLWNCIYRKKCLTGLIFPNLQIEDIPFKINMFAHGNGYLSISLIDAKLYYYYQRDNSLIRARDATTKLEVYRYLVDRYSRESKPTAQRLYLLYISKTILLYRYQIMYELTPKLNRDLRLLINQIVYLLMKSDCGLSNKYKLTHMVFLLHPKLYRLFRIINDPTMLQYEKKMKTGAAQSWNMFKEE